MVLLLDLFVAMVRAALLTVAFVILAFILIAIANYCNLLVGIIALVFTVFTFLFFCLVE